MINLSRKLPLALALAHTDDTERALDLGRNTLHRARTAMGQDHLITLIAATAVTFALIARRDNGQAHLLADATMQHARSRLPPSPIITALTDAIRQSSP